MWKILRVDSLFISYTPFFVDSFFRDRVNSRLIMGSQSNFQMKEVPGEFGYVLQDVPHFSDYISDLQVIYFYVLLCVVRASAG